MGKSYQQILAYIQSSEEALENVIKCGENGCNTKHSRRKEKIYEKNY